MRRACCIFLCSVLLFSLTAQQSPDKEITDINGRNLIDYYLSEEKSALKSGLTESSLTANLDTDPLWSYTTMGTLIGRNSMHSIDIDNDGDIEIICSAKYNDFESVWYILEYNASTDNYNINWSSPLYAKAINCIEVVDLDGDLISEILVGYGNQLEIFDGQSLTLNKSHECETEIKHIAVGDADNDDKKEIIIQCAGQIELLNACTCRLEQVLNFDASSLRIGNVDNDEKNEIVLNSGKIMELTDRELSEEWCFHSESEFGYVELSDIDKDGINEVIYASNWYKISVFDVDSESTKYVLHVTLSVHDLLLFDTNNDGIDEIIYGDGHKAYIHCIDAVSQEELWTVRNPEHGVTKICIADADKDGDDELIWGAGWKSVHSEYLLVADLETKAIEWQSKHLDGPFYAVEVGDIDSDGVDEIVSISRRSDSGYSGGIITVFDAETHEIEWQCDGDYLGSTWAGVFNVEINDVDKDDDVEIIIGADKTFYGRVWVINGKTKVVEQSKIYYDDDIDEITALTINDIDNDGVKEIITSGRDRICIINSSDLSVEWKSPDYDYETKPSNVAVENIDDDASQEIITCNQNIFVIDAELKSVQISHSDEYTDFDITDADNDGVQDIVAVTSSGAIHILDQHLELASEIKVIDSSINNITITDLNNDGIDEYILSVNGQIVFVTVDGPLMTTEKYGSVAGEFDAMKFYDFDGDGKKELVIGTINQVVVLPSDIYQGEWFATKVDPNSQVGLDGVFTEGLDIFPNPATEYLHIELPVNQTVDYHLYDLSGTLVLSGKLYPSNGGYAKIDLSSVRAGSYLIRFTLNDQMVSRQIIVR